MTISIAVLARNNMLDGLETFIGASPVLKLRTGSPPGIGNADSGTVVATMTLPSDWMGDAAAGVKAKSGTWEDLSADSAGTVGHFRIYKSDGTTQEIEGTVTITSGGGDIELDNNVVEAGQQITITTFQLTAPNP